MVGDRSTTDVVTGHRISEILDGRIKDQELGQRDSASDGGSSGKGDGCLTVLTTGIHKSEKLGTRFMRGVEYKLIKHFLKRGIRPGAKGWKKSDESEVMSLKPRGIEKVGLSLGLVSSKNRWQSLAVKSSSNTTSSTSASNVTLTLNPQELSPSTKLQKPSLTHFILPIFPSKLQPYLLQFFNLSSVWPIKPVLTLMGEGWDLILKGVKIGVRLQMPNGNSRKRDALEIGDISEKRFGSINRRDTVIGNSRNSFRNGSGSNARSFSSTSFLTKSSSCKSNSISSSNSTSTSRFSRLPSKNWLAALSALILVPVCYLLGAGLHEYRSEKAALKEEERMRNLNLGLNEREILEMKEKREGEELEGRRKSEERDRGERRKR